MGGMASAAANDVKTGLGLQPNTGDPYVDDGRTGFDRRTEQRKARERAAEAARAFGDDNPRPRQPAPPRAAPAVNYGIAPVAAAPSVPDPDAIGETEQALLDQQKKGRSSTIQTSAKGLLSGEDDTRKKRSLMGGLIS